MSGKWYIKYDRADDEKCSIIYLTEDEHKAVCKFLTKSEYVGGGDHCGYCSISGEGYSTKEDAIIAINGCI